MKRGLPRTKQTTASPNATLAPIDKKDNIVKPSGKKTLNSRPMIIPLNKTGNIIESNGRFFIQILRVYLVQIAARSVASVPHTISISPNGLFKLDNKQPIVRPGIAVGVRIGNTVNASETLNCCAPKEIGATK